ncbi:MAG: hypothetical protein IJ325_08410 [Clostridia bacterium]|nr:hypothetical protein [Clostridia bacterium]
MKKITFVSFLAYVLGLVFLPLGVALVERADVGVSMIVAPAYVVYRFLSERLTWFTFGMAEYLLQAVLLVGMMIVLRRFRVSYLFSFITVLLYGAILDLWMIPVAYIPADALWMRLALFVVGLLVTALGVAFFFHTTIPPEVYELFVKEISTEKGIPLTKFKTTYDCCSCVAGVVLSFALFGFGVFVGIKWGTVVTALINGWIIGLCSKAIGKIFGSIAG